jgi:hypothetical protein
MPEKNLKRSFISGKPIAAFMSMSVRMNATPMM